MTNDKIQPTHLERTALVYVRQSSLQQVRNHTEGRRLQYALADRARALGFHDTVLIDEDQGRSGSGHQERPGFGRLLADVCQGTVGAVFALEASRLARNNRDWHHLVDLCAMTDTLIIDAEGVYDARQMNDRLLLGLKGTMSEFELGLLRQRARAAFEQKVQRGHALWELPVGFVRTEDQRIEKTPDLEVQQVIDGVFKKFMEVGSARQTTLWYWDEELLLPVVIPGTAGQEILWRRPSGHRINQMLKNPCYAGAFAYGRTAVQTVVRDGRAWQGNRRRKPQAQWKVLILDSHPGYIGWQDYQRNQQMLEENAAQGWGGGGRGAVKRGPALLTGLLRCGRCGRPLHVNYSGSTGRVPRYICTGSRLERGSASCLSAGALRLDEAVVAEVLAAIQPVGVEAALAAVDTLANDDDQKRSALTLALERAQFEARRAQRQYDAVDPDNRLVADELERRWNEALGRVGELESRIAALDDSAKPLTAQTRSELLELGSDLLIAWHHPEADISLRKRILRTVLNEIVLNNVDPPAHELHLHWQGGVHTQLRIPRNGRGKHANAAHADALELVRELSKVAEDKQIAAVLNRLGYKTGQGKSWHAHRVASLRSYHRLPSYHKRADWMTLAQVAKELGVSNTVVSRLIKDGSLPAKQVVRYAPWVIKVADLDLPAVQGKVEAVHEGRKLLPESPAQQRIPL